MTRCTACALAGLAACAHLAVLSVVEAHHPRESRAGITTEVDALPPEPDHTHQDYDRNAGIVDDNIGVTGTSSGAMPEGYNNTLDVAARIARRNFQQWQRPAWLMFTQPPDEVLPPAKFISSSS